MNKILRSNLTTFWRSVFSFHCVRGASNSICLVLDTVTTSTAVHGSPRSLYPSSFRCAPIFTPELSRDLPDGPGCAHESSWCPLLYKVMFCVSRLDVNHSFEPSCFSFVFHFMFQTRRTSDDAPRVLVAASGPWRPPPPVASASVWYCKGRWRFGYSRSLFNGSGSRHDTMFSDAAAWNCPS